MHIGFLCQTYLFAIVRALKTRALFSTRGAAALDATLKLRLAMLTALPVTAALNTPGRVPLQRLDAKNHAHKDMQGGRKTPCKEHTG